MKESMNNPGMIKQLMQMQKELKKTQKELEQEIITGSGGNGAVEIMLTGMQQFHAVRIDSDRMKNASAADMEKLVGAALKDALAKSRKLMADKLGPLGGGLPGLKS
jgi:nucleoid-associated protein EbfC